MLSAAKDLLFELHYEIRAEDRIEGLIFKKNRHI